MFHPFEYAGPLRIPPPKMQLRMRKEVHTSDAVNARTFERWQTDAPQPQGEYIMDPSGLKRKVAISGDTIVVPQAYDMAPLSSRTDKRDYRQAQPFVADGPSLAMNPYFDRYDPTRDPRNMIRELRGVVYEEKTPDRGFEESRRLLERGYASRYVPEGSDEDGLKASLMAYEAMKPRLDSITDVYRGKPPPTGLF